MIAIIIPTFNRPEYLERFFDSLKVSLMSNSSQEEIRIIIADDCSTNEKVISYLKNIENHPFVTVLRNHKNIGIALNMRSAIDYFKADAYICMDSDIIVTADALERLEALHRRFPTDLVSGFDSRNTRHHACKEQHPDYAVKASIGGASMVFSAASYLAFIRPALEREVCQGESRKWDFIACDNFTRAGRKIICTTPSVVEHIGIDSSLNHSVVATAYNFDVDSIFVSQPFGIGDVIFSAALVNMFSAKSKTWPVLPQFVDGCSRAYPQFKFLPRGLSIFNDERREEMYSSKMRYIPIRWAVENLRKPYAHVMRSKYDMYFEDWKSWKSLKPLRNNDREKALMSDLGISEYDPFILVSTRFGSDSQFSRSVSVPEGMRQIEMTTIKDYSIFDWIGVIERASEIHAVSSSILYLAALFGWCPVYVYLRTPHEKDFSTVDYIFAEYTSWKWEGRNF